MPGGKDPITGLTNPVGVCKPYYNRASRAPFIIVSQTCDIGGKGTGEKQPFVLTAPLAASTQLGELASPASQGRVGYLIASKYVDPKQPTLLWYADLRCLVSVSKGVLLAHEPGHDAFDTEGLMSLAASVAHKFARPAVLDVLVEELPRIIDTHVTNNGPTRDVFVGTEEVRLHVTRGNLINATEARVIVIVKPEVFDSAKSAWVGWEDGARAPLKNHGVKLGATLVITAKKLDADIYRQTSALRIPSLGPMLWV